MTVTSNDNCTSPMPGHDGPDAHGQAAILLVESLIHTLVSQSVIKVEDAIEVVTVALDVKLEIYTDENGQVDPTDKAAVLLSAIRESLSIDIP